MLKICDRGIGNVKEWYKCPYCGKNLLKVDKSKHFEGVFIQCRNKYCKHEVEIKNYIKSQSSDARAQDARAQKPPDDTS